MHYTVIEGIDVDDFIRHVNNAIYAGWRPLGGVSTTKPHAVAYTHYAQALTKEKTNDNT